MEASGYAAASGQVDMAVELTEVAVMACAEGIRAQYPGIGEEEVVERLRERFVWMKRWRRRARGV